MIDRLTLSGKVLAQMRQSLGEVALLPDPVGEVIRMWKRPNGLMVGKMRIPLGVVGIIYEARPNVTVDAAALCLKSGNAVLAARRFGSHSFQPGAGCNPEPGLPRKRPPGASGSAYQHH